MECKVWHNVPYITRGSVLKKLNKKIVTDLFAFNQSVMKSKIAKMLNEKRAISIVFMPTFWSNVIYTLKAKRLLVQFFSFDNEKKAVTDYILKL